MNFKLVDTEKVRTVSAVKASGTVIPKGSLVTLGSGLVVIAATNALTTAYLVEDAVDGSTEAVVTLGNDFVLECQNDAAVNFAVTQKGGEYNLTTTTGTQVLTNNASTHKCLKVDISESAGTVDSKKNVRVKILNPLF